MDTCSSCQFWTQVKEGSCSQSVLTTDRNFVKQLTYSGYSCNTYEQIECGKRIDVWEDGNNKLHLTGHYTKKYIEQVISLLQGVLDGS